MNFKNRINVIIVFYVLSAVVFLLYGREIVNLDQQMFLQINQIRNPTLDYFFLFITVGGSTVFWLLLIAALWFSKHRIASSLLLVTFLVDSMTLLRFKLLFN